MPVSPEPRDGGNRVGFIIGFKLDGVPMANAPSCLIVGLYFEVSTIPPNRLIREDPSPVFHVVRGIPPGFSKGVCILAK
jgi:hypothetical protein